MLSVIIPVYNAEKFIDKTISSILSQSYTDFELILVDDGSTDMSGEICDRYAKQDQRVKVVHKKNGGVSSARNIGLHLLKGDFLTFIDADDYVNPEYFQSAISLFEKHSEIDVIVFAWNVIKNNQSTLIPLQATGLMSADDYFKKNVSLYNNDLGGGFPWNRVWKIRDKNNIVDFDEAIYIWEDKLWLLQMLLRCNNVWLDNSAFYNYFYSDLGLSHSKGNFSAKRLNAIEAHHKISFLEYPDKELNEISYTSFSVFLAYSFCEGLLHMDIPFMTDLYVKYGTEWNKICKYCMKKKGIKNKVVAIACFIVGHTICNVCRKIIEI